LQSKEISEGDLRLQLLDQQNTALDDSLRIQKAELHQLRSENRSLTIENTQLKSLKDPDADKLLKCEASLTISNAKNRATMIQLSLQSASHNEELKEARSRLFKQEKIFILREESLLRQISRLTSLSNTEMSHGIVDDKSHPKDDITKIENSSRKFKTRLRLFQNFNEHATVHVS
jgi:hypothetical protein